MQIIERSNIDIEKWDALVNSTPQAAVFSMSWYMDACAENWSVIVDDDYTKGIALPYTIRAGVQILYTPIFIRYVEWLGLEDDFSQVQQLIHTRFKVIQITFKQKVLGENAENFVYQRIDQSTEAKLGSQAKRSLKNAEKAGLKVEINTLPDTILSVVKEELSDKYQGLNDETMTSLEALFKNAQSEKRLIAIYVMHDKVEGGIVCLQSKDSLLYLKGTVNQKAKKAGGMYLAVSTAIAYAKDKNLHFDFGGSRIEGVKKFNHNLGGEDTVYYAYTSNNGPKWFKLARRIRNKWIKK